jgi:hypothetical protein
MDESRKGLKELTVAANHLPRGLDFRFQSLNAEFRDKLAQASSQTISILTSVTSFILDLPPSEIDLSLDPDRAIRSLLDSADFDHLDRPAPKPTTFGQIERYSSGGIEFLFSRTVPKPPRFLHTNPIPNSVPIVTKVPSVFNPKPGQLSISNIRYVTRPELLIAACRTITAAYPRGPLYIGLQTHRVRTYRPIPCLLSLMTPDYSVDIIDILNCRDALDPLFGILQSPEMLHVMFAPEADLAVLSESLGLWISNVFDPAENPDVILEEAVTSFQLKKCIVDWRIRPITEELLTIAARSVWYLPFLTDKIVKSRPETEILESCARFGNPPPAAYAFGESEIEWAMR